MASKKSSQVNSAGDKYSSVSIPLPILERIDSLIEELGFWPSRGAFVREACLEKIRKETIQLRIEKSKAVDNFECHVLPDSLRRRTISLFSQGTIGLSLGFGCSLQGMQTIHARYCSTVSSDTGKRIVFYCTVQLMLSMQADLNTPEGKYGQSY